MPKQKTLKLSSNHNIRGLDENLGEGHHMHQHNQNHHYGNAKPPLMVKKNYQGASSLPNPNAMGSGSNLPSGSYVVPAESGLPAQRPQWWG